MTELPLAGVIQVTAVSVSADAVAGGAHEAAGARGTGLGESAGAGPACGTRAPGTGATAATGANGATGATAATGGERAGDVQLEAGAGPAATAGSGVRPDPRATGRRGVAMGMEE